MTEIEKIKASPKLKKSLRVCAYCRVSSDKEAMHDSLASQVSHFNELIGKHGDWQFAGIYADDAYTGTKDERPDFQRMMKACDEGKIDMILVKAVSRFARNALTVLEVTRKLKKQGIDVYFESENIHSVTSEGEMILTMVAGFAQAESKSVSDNMKWRIKREFQKGEVWGLRGMYGYKVVDKKFIVIPEEAEIVKKIFEWYIDGMGSQTIIKRLYKEGYRPRSGKDFFVKSQITAILDNIDYTGDLILQKTFVDDYISKKTKRNKGEKDKYYVEGNHEPIISKETFRKAQKIKAERAKNKTKNCRSKSYTFTNILKCANCGKSYTHKVSKYGDYWSCRTYEMYGKDACRNKKVPNKYLERAAAEAMGIDEFDEVLFKKIIEQVNVHEGQVLEFIFKNQTTKLVTWNFDSRRKSWTPEMRENAKQRALKQHQKKGADGKWQQSQE